MQGDFAKDNRQEKQVDSQKVTDAESIPTSTVRRKVDWHERRMGEFAKVFKVKRQQA